MKREVSMTEADRKTRKPKRRRGKSKKYSETVDTDKTKHRNIIKMQGDSGWEGGWRVGRKRKREEGKKEGRKEMRNVHAEKEKPWKEQGRDSVRPPPGLCLWCVLDQSWAGVSACIGLEAMLQAPGHH